MVSHDGSLSICWCVKGSPTAPEEYVYGLETKSSNHLSRNYWLGKPALILRSENSHLEGSLTRLQGTGVAAESQVIMRAFAETRFCIWYQCRFCYRTRSPIALNTNYTYIYKKGCYFANLIIVAIAYTPMHIIYFK